MIEIKKENPKKIIELFSEFYSDMTIRLTQMAIDKCREGNISLLFTAREGRNYVGISGTYKDSKGEKQGFTVVKKSYRNNGIGTALLRKRIEFDPDTNISVWEKNIPSITMCKKAGLKIIGSKQHYSKLANEWRTILIFR